MYYYQHNIGDFDKKTRHLTRIERSIYLDMIHLYYTTEEQLCVDVAMICRKILARTEEEKSAVIAVLDEFFAETPKGWYHDRCEEEIAEYRKTKSQASAAGKASALAREERRLAAMQGISVENERRVNGTPTVVERSLNGGSTVAQREANESSTGGQREANQTITNNHKPVTNNQEPKEQKTKAPPSPSGEVLSVFEYWQKVMGHNGAKLDVKRSKAIVARLKDGYTPEQLCRAVDGCKMSPYHQGQNDTRTIHDDIELICRDGPKVDGFIKKSEAVPTGFRTSNQQQTLDNLQRYLKKDWE